MSVMAIAFLIIAFETIYSVGDTRFPQLDSNARCRAAAFYIENTYPEGVPVVCKEFPGCRANSSGEPRNKPGFRIGDKSFGTVRMNSPLKAGINPRLRTLPDYLNYSDAMTAGLDNRTSSHS